MPNLEADPDTELPCVMWHDNFADEEMTCEEVRDYWNISPEQFTEWNPSVGLDCKPWRELSYCVVPLSRLPTTTSRSSEVAEPTSTTTSSSTLGPTPTSWEFRGCYEDDYPGLPTFEKMMLQDDTVTIEKCQDLCYRSFFEFAGLKDGDQCWCSPFIGGEWTSDQDDCNAACSGDESQTCGGKGVISAYEPEFEEDYDYLDVDDDEEEEDTNEDEEQDDSNNKGSSTDDEDDRGEDEPEDSGSSDDAESGASRYRAFFGIL